MADDRAGINAVVVGSRLLRALSEARRPMPLKQLAVAGDMSASKAHRYLVSFVDVGLVSQDKTTRLYSLGPLAVQIGMSALGAYKPLQAAIALQADLRNRFDETFVLSVWSANGPVVIHIDESSLPIIVTMRIGAVLPILTTATGLTFLAHLPSFLTQRLINGVFRKAGHRERFAHTREELDGVLATVRADGHAYNAGHLTPGVSALAVPITDHFDSLVAVTAVMGQDEHINPAQRPDLAAAMKRSRQTSGRLRPHAQGAAAGNGPSRLRHDERHPGV